MTQDPNVLLTILAADSLALEAIQSFQNRDRYLPPYDDGSPSEDKESQSRSTSPSTRVATPEGDEINSFSNTRQRPRLQLRFDQPPKDPNKGFVFGSDSQCCDVFLGKKSIGVSGQHFAITLDQQSRLVLTNLSRHGTSVSYNGQGADERRRQFRWILLPGWNLRVHVAKTNRIVFILQLPDHSGCRSKYTELLRSYIYQVYRDVTPGHQKQKRQRQLGCSDSKDSDEMSIYVDCQCLGEGSFGTVYKSVNVTTGDYAAVKRFHPNSKYVREVKVMKRVSHKHIVRYIDSIEGPHPGLVMEYLPLGSLEKYEITDKEKRTLFVQMLDALQYLHGLGLAHRDIKPANILIKSRGDNFWSKLGDFGFAKSDWNLETLCGSSRFLAPEIWAAARKSRPYTKSVDIWSLGVVMLDLCRKLPTSSRKGRHDNNRDWDCIGGLDFCNSLVQITGQMRREDSENPLLLVLSRMLVVDVAERMEAKDCLQLYMQHAVESDPATSPTPSPPSSPELEEVISPSITRRNTALSSRGMYKTSVSAEGPSDISILAREICMELARNDPDFANQSWSEVLELKRRGLLPTPRATSRVNTGGSSEVNAMDCRLLDKLESGRVNQIWDDLPAVEQPGEPLRSVTLDDILDRFNSSNGGNTSKWKRSMDDAQNPEFSGRDGRSRREFSSPANTSVFVVNTNLRGKSYNEIEDPVAKAISGLLDELQPELGPSNVANGKSHIQEICKQVRRLDISQLQINRQRGRIDVIALSSGNKTISFTLEGSRGESAAELLLQKMQDQSRAIYKGEIRKQRRPYNYDYNAADEVPAQPKKRFKPSFPQSELLSCRIKDRIVHYRLSDEKICFEELALAAPRSRAWINGKIGKFHDSDKEQCVYGTLVDFSAALPIIKELGLVLAVRKATGFSETPKMQEYRGKKYFPATIGGNEKAILYFCPEDQRVNASRLLEAGGKRRALKDEVLKQCGIRDVLQVRGHPKLQGCYITYADGRKLCRFLGLEVPDAIRGHDGEKEFLKEVNTGADNLCSVHTTFRAESVEGQIETSPPSAEPNTPERALQKKEEGFWRSQVHSHPGEPGPNEGTETTDNPSENDDHMASRVTYMDSSRSCLVAVKPQYGPASVGHPLSGLNMASFEGYYSSFDATSAVPDV